MRFSTLSRGNKSKHCIWKSYSYRDDFANLQGRISFAQGFLHNTVTDMFWNTFNLHIIQRLKKNLTPKTIATKMKNTLMCNQSAVVVDAWITSSCLVYVIWIMFTIDFYRFTDFTRLELIASPHLRASSICSSIQWFFLAHDTNVRINFIARFISTAMSSSHHDPVVITRHAVAYSPTEWRLHRYRADRLQPNVDLDCSICARCRLHMLAYFAMNVRSDPCYVYLEKLFFAVRFVTAIIHYITMCVLALVPWHWTIFMWCSHLGAAVALHSPKPSTHLGIYA